MKKVSVFAVPAFIITGLCAVLVFMIAGMCYGAENSNKSSAKEMVVAAEAFMNAHGKGPALTEFNGSRQRQSSNLR